MATVVNMQEAKSTLSRLVKRAAAGEEIVIARNGKPMAKLTRVRRQRKKIPWGKFKGFVADDFDAPLEQFKEYM